MTKIEAEFCVDAMEMGFSFCDAKKMSRFFSPDAIKEYWELTSTACERNLSKYEVENLHRIITEITGGDYV